MCRAMHTTTPFDLLCIGSGPAGRRAAVQAAKFGRRVAVIERRRVMGGVCVETGTIPSKTFREAVLALHPRSPFRTNTQPRTRPTAQDLFARVQAVVARESSVIIDQLSRNGIDVIGGTARFVDPHTVAIDDGESEQIVTAENILIAVGTRPTPAPGIPEDDDVVLTSDTIYRIPQLPRTLAVIGGGVIGIEYASMFAELGIEVTVIDRRPRLMEFLDSEIVDELVHQLRNRNVVFRLDEGVDDIHVDRTGSASKAVLQLSSGKRVVADMALYSAGRTGATADLGLENAGLTADDRGRIKVDADYRTEVEHIFAAGDVIGFPALAATSGEQGRRVACGAFGAHACAMPPHFPVGIYSIPEISMVGKTEEELTSERVPYEIGIARYREISRGQILGDDSGMLKMLFHRETRDLLGVHAIGTGATELIHVGQAVLALGGGLDYFINTVFNYPTLAECYKVAAYDALNKLDVDVEDLEESNAPLAAATNPAPVVR